MTVELLLRSLALDFGCDYDSGIRGAAAGSRVVHLN